MPRSKRAVCKRTDQSCSTAEKQQTSLPIYHLGSIGRKIPIVETENKLGEPNDGWAVKFAVSENVSTGRLEMVENNKKSKSDTGDDGLSFFFDGDA